MTDFKKLAQLSSDALLVVAGGRIAYANPAAQALMAPAAGAQGLSGLAVPALWLPDPLDGPWAGDGPLAPVTVQLQTGHSTAPGTMPGIALELTATRDQTPEGPVYYVKACRMQAGGDMLAERVRTALAVSTDAAMVVEAQTLAFLDANPAACALMGMTLEAVRTRGPTTMRRRDGAGQEDFRALYAQLIERSPQAQTHEYDFLADDGRTIPIAATRQALNVDGQWLIFITWRDISAQVSAQALVQQFKDSFDQTPDATNIIDVQTLSYVYVNEPFVRLMGLPRERILAGGPQSMPKEIVVVDDLADFLASVVAHHPHTLVREKTVTLPDGRQATFESHHQAVFSGGRWLVRATRVDITQRKEQHRHLQQILAAFDASSDAIYIIDPKTFAYVDVNEAAALLHGVPRDELRSLGVRGAFPGQFDDAGLQARYDELIARYPQALAEDRQIPRADGKVVWTESIRRAIRVDDEWRVINVMRDITARKEAQQQLELLLAAMDSAPDAIAIVDPHTYGYVHVNDAVCRLHGLTREQVMALGMLGMFTHFTPETLRRRYDDLIAMAPQAVSEERTVRRPDGSEVTTEAARRAVRVGDRWLVISVSRDVTERKAAQAHLDILKAAFDAAPDGIGVMDPQALEFVAVNESAARIHGLTRAQMLARNVRGLVGPGVTQDGLRATYADIIAKHPKAVVEEREVRREDGSSIMVEAVRSAVKVGNRWLVIGVNRDISERKAAQARLELMNQAMNAAPDTIVAIDAETLQYIAINDAATQMTGMTREEMYARGPQASFSGAFDPQGLRTAYAQVIAQAPHTVTEERSVPRADRGGQDAVLEFTRRAVQIDGRWVIVSVNRDITERKARQAHLDMLRAAIDLAPDAFFLIDPQALQYIHVNRAAGAMYGLSREQVLSLGLLGYVRQVGHYGHDEALARLNEDYAEVIAQYPQPQVVERSVRLPGRDVVYNENVRKAVPLDGRWLIVSVTRDITERKRQQARMERFAAIVNMSADAVMLVDRTSMRIIDVNDAACRMHGYSRDELLALPPHLLRDGATPEQLTQDYDDAIRQWPAIVHSERNGRNANGSTFAAEVQRQAHKQPDDGAWIVTTTVRDISERKAAQARQELLTAAIEAAPDGIAVVDPQTLQYLHVNDAVCRTHAASREQLMTLGVDGMFRDQIAPDAIRAIYQTIIDSFPRAMSEERAIVALDGSTAYYEAVRRAVQVDGRWLIVSMNRDVTERKAAQARIERFAAVLNLSADAVLLVDRDSVRIIDVNEAACRMYGYTRDEMLALAPHDGRGDTTRERLIADYDEAIRQSPQVVHAEITARRADGSTFIAEVQRQALRSSTGDGWIIAIIARDITQRKAAEAGLQRLKAVVDVAPDGMYIIDPEQQEYVTLNHAAGQLYGLTRDEVLQMGMVGFMRWLGSFDGAFTPETIRERHFWLIDNYPKIHTSERLVRLPGRVDIVTETLRQAVQVDGQWLILVVVRDITLRKRAEDEIRKRVAELELLREAYDAAVDAILIADPETLGYYDVNQAAVKLLGVSREELLTRGVEASYYSTAGEPFDAERFRKGSRYVISRAPEALIEVRTVNPLGLGGRDTVIEFSRRAVNVDGRWVIVTLMRDITANKRAEEEIRQRVAELTRSNQELEQFAYVTSHDLSEPLRMVASYTQLLSKRYADKFDDDGREFIKYAVDGAQRMKQLIDDLLMYSRAGRSKVPMRHVRLDRSLDDALANLAHAIERNGATIERTPLPELVCEKAGLTQVFQNLVGNAIKFRGDAAPVVRISAVEDEHFWTISVADNGIGISSEYFQRIFVIFQRLHARTKYEGTGIGLSICKKIVERHGGQITVTSEPGQGTTFSFTLSKSLKESESP